MLIILILLSGCLSNNTQINRYDAVNHPYENTNAIKIFRKLCLGEFIKTRKAPERIHNYGFEPVIDGTSYEYTGGDYSFVFKNNNLVISISERQCSVFDHYSNTKTLNKILLETVENSYLKDSIKMKPKFDISKSEGISQLSIDFINDNDIHRVSAFSTSKSSSKLIEKFTNRKPKKDMLPSFVLHSKSPKFVKSIISINIGSKIPALLTSYKSPSSCQILTELFGNCIKNSAFWSLPTGFYTSPVNLNSNKKQYWNKSKGKVVSNVINHFIIEEDTILAIIQTKPIGNMYNCHGCAPLLGAAILERTNQNWSIKSKNDSIKFTSSWGEIKKDTIQLIDNSGLFSVNNHHIAQGYHTFSSTIISPNKKSFKTVWNGVTGRSNKGACGPASKFGPATPCTSFKYDISFSKDKINSRPNMIMQADVKGTPKNKDYKGSKLLYKYDGQKYTLKN